MVATRQISASRFAVDTIIRDALITSQDSNPIDNPEMTSPPTITGVNDTSLSTSFTYQSNPTAFSIKGGVPTQVQNLGSFYNYGARVGSSRFSPMIVEFSTDAPKFRFGAIAGTWQIEINGQIVSKAGNASSAGGGEQWIVVDWGGVRAPRRYRFIGSRNSYFSRIGVDALSRVWATNRQGFKIAYEGDSYLEGTAGSPSVAPLGIPAMSARLMGADDFRVTAVGGTGWMNAGSATTLRGRIADLIATGADVVAVAAGTNDNSANASAITTEVATHLQELREGLPRALVKLYGVWPQNTGPAASMITIENAVKAGFDQVSDSRMAFIPVSTDPTGPWIFGTGSNGSGSGNAALYQGSGGVHTNDAGQEYLARRMAVSGRKALLSMLA